MNDPTVLHFGSLDRDLAPDKERPMYFRRLATNTLSIEFNFFPVGTIDPISQTLLDDCKNDLDLILKKTA